MLHYLIEFTVQFPGFSLSQKNNKSSYLIVVEILRKKTKQNPTTYSIGNLKIYHLIGVFRSFGLFVFCGDGQNFGFINVKTSAKQSFEVPRSSLHCHLSPKKGGFLLYFVLDVKKVIISN